MWEGRGRKIERSRDCGNREPQKQQSAGSVKYSWSYPGTLKLALRLSPKREVSGCLPDLLSLSQRLARTRLGG